MMKAQELRLGNWIYGTNEKPSQVTIEALTYLLAYEGIHQATPIPLTEEILLKAGFGEPYKGEYVLEFKTEFQSIFYIRYILDDNTIVMSIKYMIDSYENFSVPNDIYYVHQLQNLFFFLTETELTITI